jgi:hypothetical protein
MRRANFSIAFSLNCTWIFLPPPYPIFLPRVEVQKLVELGDLL